MKVQQGPRCATFVSRNAGINNESEASAKLGDAQWTSLNNTERGPLCGKRGDKQFPFKLQVAFGGGGREG